jgi:hypothetical protein
MGVSVSFHAFLTTHTLLCKGVRPGRSDSLAFDTFQAVVLDSLTCGELLGRRLNSPHLHQVPCESDLVLRRARDGTVPSKTLWAFDHFTPSR